MKTIKKLMENFYFSCSVDCFKSHKETPCNKPPDKTNPSEIDEEVKKQILLFTTVDTISLEKLKELSK